MKVIINESQKELLLKESMLTISEIKKKIKNLHGLSNDLKNFAIAHIKTYSNPNKGNVSGLELPSEFRSKLNNEKLPNGFDMGVDKNGYYIHTHRARSKSNKDYMKISKKDIKFIDSTG